MDPTISRIVGLILALLRTGFSETLITALEDILGGPHLHARCSISHCSCEAHLHRLAMDLTISRLVELLVALLRTGFSQTLITAL